jgi:hypothetical protein
VVAYLRFCFTAKLRGICVCFMISGNSDCKKESFEFYLLFLLFMCFTTVLYGKLRDSSERENKNDGPPSAIL